MLNQIFCLSSSMKLAPGGGWAYVWLEGCTFGLFLSGEACELVAGWICVHWSVSVLWRAAPGSVGLRIGDQMSLMKNPMSCGTVLWPVFSQHFDCISVHVGRHKQGRPAGGWEDCSRGRGSNASNSDGQHSGDSTELSERSIFEKWNCVKILKEHYRSGFC